MISKFDIEAGVVVVGYGGAGAVAAITAHDAGSNVLVLEKMASGGGNTRISGGSVSVPTDKGFVEYLEKLTFKCTPKEILEAYVDEALHTEEWVKKLGGELVKASYLRVTIPPSGTMAYDKIPGREFGSKKQIKGKAGVAPTDDPPSRRLWNLLSSNCESRGIKVMFDSPVKDLVTDASGQVIGVIAQSGGKEIAIKAKQAVVLTCGGYEYDDKMKWDNLPARPTICNGNPGNTGDGIRMTQRLGAAIWHMPNLSCCSGFKAPGFEAAFPVKFYSEKFIFVDKYGKRFINEPAQEIHDYGRMFANFDSHKIEYPRIPMYAVFDEILRRRAPLCDGICGYNRETYKWSLDNSEEVKKGWIFKGKNVGELAEKAGLDKVNLEATVRRYNEYAKKQEDPDFGRAKEYLTPLTDPPYYAIQLWPALYNTQGGPVRDRNARVMTVDGKPIPRLYAAGELGSIWGILYQGGSNNGESLAFGRIAGRNAAAEKALE